MYHWGLPSIIVCSNDDPWIDHDLFYSQVEFCNLGFSIGKRKIVDLSETIAACDLKVGKYRQLIEYVKLYEYSMSMSFLDLGQRSFTYEP